MSDAKPKPLLPCPFCGGIPGIEWAHHTRGDYTVYLVSGCKEECPTHPEASGRTENEAIAAWNTRAHALAEENARLREALERAVIDLDACRTIQEARQPYLRALGLRQTLEIARAALNLKEPT